MGPPGSRGPPGYVGPVVSLTFLHLCISILDRFVCYDLCSMSKVEDSDRFAAY